MAVKFALYGVSSVIFVITTPDFIKFVGSGCFVWPKKNLLMEMLSGSVFVKSSDSEKVFIRV